MVPLRIGCAGFSVPRAHWDRSGAVGSHLERTARLFNCVEINTSFYRHHQRTTYERWAASVPTDFRFAVKLMRTMTHERHLQDCADELEQFFSEVNGLGQNLGPILVQLPPRAAFDRRVASSFFASLRRHTQGPVVCEPRHASWFSDDATEVLMQFDIARCAVDPAPIPSAERPGGAATLLYYRLHGSPKMYLSPYAPAQLSQLASEFQQASAALSPHQEIWCIFDNTMVGHATTDALFLAGAVKNAPQTAKAHALAHAFPSAPHGAQAELSSPI